MNVKIDDHLLDGLENFIADRDRPPLDRMSYEIAVNVILRDWLMGQGYVPLPNEPDGTITPALEAADIPR